MEPVPEAQKCAASCPVHCQENRLEEIRLIAENLRRAEALHFAFIYLLMMLMADFYFISLGKPFPVPEIAWLVAIAPWCGDGASKLINLIRRDNK